MDCPYKPSVPVTSEDGIFIRTNLLEDVKKIIKQGDNRGRHSYAIIGGKGMGKTSILKETRGALLKDLTDPLIHADAPLIIPFFIELPRLENGATTCTNLSKCLSTIITRIQSDLPKVRSIVRLSKLKNSFKIRYWMEKTLLQMNLRGKSPIADSLHKKCALNDSNGLTDDNKLRQIKDIFICNLLKLGEECKNIVTPNRVRIVLFIDAFHRIEHNEAVCTELAGVFFEILSGFNDEKHEKRPISLVLSLTRDLSELLPLRGEGFHNYIDSEPLTVFSEENSYELIRFGNPSKDPYQDQTQIIHEWVGGHPLFTHLVMEEIWRNSKFAELTRQNCEAVIERVSENDNGALEEISLSISGNEMELIFSLIASSSGIDRGSLLNNKTKSEKLILKKAVRRLKYCGLVVETQDQILKVSGKYFEKEFPLQKIQQRNDTTSTEEKPSSVTINAKHLQLGTINGPNFGKMEQEKDAGFDN